MSNEKFSIQSRILLRVYLYEAGESVLMFQGRSLQRLGVHLNQMAKEVHLKEKKWISPEVSAFLRVEFRRQSWPSGAWVTLCDIHAGDNAEHLWME